MADDINAARRAELLAQRAVLEPQIRGLHDDVLTIISDDLKAAFQHQIMVKERRRDLIDAEVAGMDIAEAREPERQMAALKNRVARSRRLTGV